MNDRPILFSGSMVRAILREIERPGTGKTQTRRVIKLPHQNPLGVWEPTTVGGKGVYFGDGSPAPERPAIWHTRTGDCIQMKYAAGNRLWVREAWWHPEPYSYGTSPSGDEMEAPRMVSKFAPIHFAADGNPPNCSNRHYGQAGLRGGKFAAPDPWAVWTKRPSIHMPKWASRITLEVTGVKVERLQDISEEDAVAEGCFKGKASGRVFANQASMHFGGDQWANALDWYADLWEEINGRGSWEANPWVAVYTFRPILGNIDQIGGGDDAR